MLLIKHIAMEAKGENIHLLELPALQKKQDFLFISDVHFDSKKCDRELLKKHLDEAKKRDAWIHINGDFFDVMGAKKDPRSNKSDIRPEYMTNANYFDLIIEDGYKFLEPYKEKLFITYGNHETSITKHHEIDIINTLGNYLWGFEGKKNHIGAYQGWLLVKFNISNEGGIKYVKMNYHHSTKGGERSKGVLGVDLNCRDYPNADIVLRGHIHQKWVHSINYGNFINVNNFKVQQQNQYHICTGSYKNGIGNNTFGYEVEKRYANTKLGGYFCEVSIVGHSRDVKCKIYEAD